MKFFTRAYKNASLYLTGSLIQGLTPFLLTPVLTRALEPETFSRFVLFIAIGTVLSFLFTLGLPAALTRELIMSKKEFDNNLSAIGYLKIRWLQVAFILIVFSLFFDHMLELMLISVSLGLLLALVQIDLAIFRALQKAKEFVYTAVASTALPTALIAVLLLGGYFEEIFLQIYLIFVLILVLILFKPYLNVNKKINNLKPLIKMGGPTILHGIGMSLMQYGDRIVIAAALGLTAAGQVQIASLLGTASILLLSTLNNAWMPVVLEKFSEARSTGEKFLNQSSIKLAGFISFISVTVMLLVDPLLKLFAPAAYKTDELVPVVIIMSIGAPLYIIYLRNTHILTYLGKFQSLAWITPISISLQISSIFVFAKSFELLSVSFAILFSVISQALLTQLVIQKIYPKNSLTYVPIAFFFLLIITALLLLYF